MVEIKDSDAIHQPDTSGAEVFSVQDVMSRSRPPTKEQIIEMFPDVSMKALVCLKASTTSDLTIQPDQSNTLFGEVKSHFATRSKRAWKNFLVPK